MRKRILPSKKTPSQKGDTTPRTRSGLSAPRLPVLSSSWLLHSEVGGCSPSTLENRKGVLSKLEWFLGERKLVLVDTHALLQFFHYLKNGHTDKGGRWGNPQNTKPVSAGTVATYHRVLSAFFNWCVKQGEVTESPLGGVPVPIDRPDQVQPLSEDQMRGLLAATRHTLHPDRDEAVVLLLLDTGLRVSELCALNCGDVDMTRCTLVVKEGKGGKARFVPFAPEVRKALYKYLSGLAENGSHDALFPSDRGQTAGDPLTRRGVLRLLKRIGAKAGISGDRCSPHKLRHSYAVAYLRAGGNQFALMANLGHTSLTMTTRYVKIAQADVENQHKTCSPITNLKARGKKR